MSEKRILVLRLNLALKNYHFPLRLTLRQSTRVGVAAFVNIAITEACPAHLCSPLRTETENAKRSFGFFITTTAGKPISGKLPRHSLLQGNEAFCQKWEQKTPRIFKNLWRCCLEQYSILVSRSLFWVKEKDNRFWLSCENVYYVVLCMIDKIKFEDHSSTKYLYAAASSSPHSLSKLPFSS